MAGIAAALIGGAAAIGGGLIAGSAAKSASKAQARAAQQGIDAQREMFDKQTALQEPFRQGGLTAQNQLMTLLGLGGDNAAADYGSAAQPFGMDQFQADPGYGFRMSEGMKALESSAAARGGLLSGSAMKGAQRFGQDLGSQEYMNAFNRYQTERAARLNPLQSLMGSGQTAANTLTGAAGQLGQGLAQGYGNLGQAQASSYVGGANAAMGGVQGISNAVQGYYNNQFMNNFMNPYSSGAGGYKGQGPFMSGRG